MSDALAFDVVELAPVSSGEGRWRQKHLKIEQRETNKSLRRFGTEHLVATLLAIVVHYAISFASVLKNWYRWRVASLDVSSPKSDKTRIVLLYANVGSGHKMAATALERAFLVRDPNKELEVVKIDIMDCCPAIFRYQMQTLFQELTQSLAGQHLLGFAYDAADRGRAKANMHRFIEMFVSLEMVRKLSKIRPDHVVCTHFLPAQVLGDLRSKRVNSVMRAQASALKLSLVLTDLDLQYMWVNDVDTYFVPREEAVYMLGAYGALEGGATASVSGIPIFPAFIPKSEEARSPDPRVVEASRLRELEALGKWKGVELGKGGWPKAADARPTVLFISSGNSVGEIYSRILACATPLRIIVGTGRQADVREMLTAMAVPSRHAVKMLGFVTDALDEKGRCDTPGGMPTLLRCTTIFIGKSGGLAIAEAAALKVPMIILDPIPGQEQRNADVLLEAGAAVKINDLPLITKRVDEALANGGAKAKSMAEAMGRIGRPNAAFTIVDAVLRGEVRSVHVGAHEHTE